MLAPNPSSGESSMDEPAWLVSELPRALRWSVIFRTAWKMALHDRQQTIAAILGVSFAYVLIGANMATAGHYVGQASSYIDESVADLWIVPPSERTFALPGRLLSTNDLHQATVTPGVEWASPIARGYTAIKLPNGGLENIILIGVPVPDLRGGPFYMVKGDPSVLMKPDAIVIEDSDREKLGGLNLGSTVEVAGRRAQVEGLTWGLVTLFGPYAFAEYDFARSILEIDADRCSVVLVRLDGTVPLGRVREELRQRIPDAQILTKEEYRRKSRDFILYDAGLIGIISMGLGVGITVGLAIVTLAMLSAVQQNIREFGTLKAIGVTNADLRLLLLFHALGCSVIGAFLGAAFLCQICWASRTARLIMMLDPLLLWGLVPCVTLVAVVAALVAIQRISRVEPASVFR